MSRKIVLNISPYETRAAILENDQPIEFFFENKDTEKIVGCIFKGRVSNVVPGTQAAFVDIGIHKDAYLALAGVEANESEDEDDLKEIYKRPIQDVLRVGQEVILQILKEPTPTKGPRSTMALSFPGRYLVLMPTVDHVGISRRISTDSERDRLKSIGKKICPKGMGVIFRTTAEGLDESVLQADFRWLLKVWHKMEARARGMPVRSMIHRDIPLPLKLVRDFFTDNIDRFIIDSPDEYKNILEFCDFLSPLQRAALELYEGEMPIFEAFKLEKEIDNALQTKLWLESGGYIFIQRTEALVAIDVNSGRFSGGSDLEETVFKVNLEAAKIIARQIRLRNLAGMIIIDFIDMTDPKHRSQVLKTLREAFKGDRNRPNILDFSELGLIQMTRKRTSNSLEEILKTPCSFCGGQGSTLSLSMIANRIRHEVISDAQRYQTEKITIKASQEIVEFFKTQNEQRLKELENRVKRQIILVSNSEFQIDKYKIEPHTWKAN